MSEEIKEINIPKNVLVALGDLTNGTLNYYKATETVKVKHNTILDYITNLQEENKKLRSKIWQIKDLKETWQDVKENVTLVFDNNNLINFMNKLQNILKGDNND